MVLAWEPIDVADPAEQLGGQHRADAEQLHQAGLGLGDRGRDALLDRGDVLVQVADVGDQVGGELVAGDRRRATWVCSAEQRGGAVGGEVAARTGGG